jgi:hypothetical protein
MSKWPSVKNYFVSATKTPFQSAGAGPHTDRRHASRRVRRHPSEPLVTVRSTFRDAVMLRPTAARDRPPSLHRGRTRAKQRRRSADTLIAKQKEIPYRPDLTHDLDQVKLKQGELRDLIPRLLADDDVDAITLSAPRIGASLSFSPGLKDLLPSGYTAIGGALVRILRSAPR